MKKILNALCTVLLLCILFGAVSCDRGEFETSESELMSKTETETEIPSETPTDAETVHIHDWSEASCTEPKTCLECGDVDGEPLGHISDATCVEGAVCSVCGVECPATGKHDFSGKVVTDEYLSTPATMVRPAVYFYSCLYCGKKTTKRFSHGGSIREMLTAPYNKLLQGDTEGDYYLYFTDPHSVPAGEIAEVPAGNEKRITSLGEIFKEAKASFVLCGGDWLNNSSSKESAISVLSWIRNKMTETFGENSYLVVGNHDCNYQIKDPETGKVVSSPNRLTSEEIADAWLLEDGKTYYTFTSDASRFYVFDSGIDWGHNSGLTDLDREQIAWYLEELSKNDDAHIVLAPHMVHTAGESFHPATQEFALIGNIYNSRGTYEYDGKIYDFSQKTGMVEYIIAGHDHASESGVLEGIPFILVAPMFSGSDPTADLVFVNYTERKIYTTRLGDGQSREIALITIEG